MYDWTAVNAYIIVAMQELRRRYAPSQIAKRRLFEVIAQDREDSQCMILRKVHDGIDGQLVPLFWHEDEARLGARNRRMCKPTYRYEVRR